MTVLPGDTTGIASCLPALPLCREHSQGAVRSAGREMLFSSFNIFIISDIFLIANDLCGVKPCFPVPQNRNVSGGLIRECLAGTVVLLSDVTRVVAMYHGVHQDDFSLWSPLQVLFPARVPFSISSSMKI